MIEYMKLVGDTLQQVLTFNWFTYWLKILTLLTWKILWN